ncbi:Transcriptional regulator SLK2 [Actinidia chinensis var. chinensis]|uniref:Transcriptional regulator SLK2 n=1 Tax=Actinidia chinensis var. chinensis TaxID=1590841 RepID=A0A2R6PI40_ACTCC|nr:Transcriptional regulator SLK2 [Actinidia chinensis var. chinensis]
MALEAYLDAIGQSLPLAAPNHRTGGLLESLGSSIFLQSGGLSETAAASHLDMSSGNLSAYIARMTHLNANLVPGDINSAGLNNSTNSGPSVGSSSLVTDANSPLAGATHLQRSGSANMDSYLNLPSSPLSFSSNNLSASVMNPSSIAQPTSSHHDQHIPLGQKRLLQQHQVGGTAMSQTTSQTRGVSLPAGKRQESGMSQKYKKPRLDSKSENILHQQIIQQLLQKKNHMQLQDHNQQLHALMQQHKLQNLQQQQILQTIPQFLGVPTQQQQQLTRNHLQLLANHQVSVQPHDGGICSRRLMQYIYHLRHRPPDNTIAYWRKFVGEYYAPGAKKRWCLSLYDNIGEHALGVFSHSTKEAWHCDICGSKSGKGFEAIFEILPRLSKLNFESGVIDELLFLDFPHECRFPSGLMMLSYGKAVQESVYEQFRVVREGQLRIIFSPDLKILSWEFCARRHEELVPRRLVAPQVNQLIQAAKKCQNSSKNGGSDGVSAQDLQLNCNMFVTAGRQLTRNMELLLVNDLGFSKRYVRCLQIAEVVNSMKELMTFSRDNNIGPMESLRRYSPQETTRSTTNNQIKQMHEMEWLASSGDLPTDKNRLMVASPGPRSNMNENSITTKDETVMGPQKTALAGMNRYQKLPRQNSTSSAVKQEPSCSISINSSSQRAIPLPGVCPQSSNPGMIRSSPTSNSATSPPSQTSDDLQQLMIHKLLQEMASNTRATEGTQTGNGKVKEEFIEELNGSAVGNFSTRAGVTGKHPIGQGLDNISTGPAAIVLGRRERHGFHTASNDHFSGIYGDNSFVGREPDILDKFHLPESIQNMDLEFYTNGVLNDDWKV